MLASTTFVASASLVGTPARLSMDPTVSTFAGTCSGIACLNAVRVSIDEVMLASEGVDKGFSYGVKTFVESPR